MAIVKALLFLGVVSSNVFAIEAPIPGYDIETLGRNVHLDPRDGGDSPITLSDTIEQGTSKVKKLNPRWARDLEMRKPLPDNEPRCTATREWPCKVDCIDDLQGGPWYRADLLFVREGFDYLMKHSGKPKLGPGPDKCERVSCSYKSSIWWCNKSSEPKELPSFKEIVRIARTILDDCIRFDGQPSDWVGGQAFLEDWSVIIRQDSENC
ncbi:hypothetical protein E4U35_005131 [Claviceps purpurea]|nr:hypothetical protein E4U51_001761 [Claviceps purpurea]KAG6179654.1 hypothetical protein E4U36_005425 [Claviceps purpurea]KAG6202610.1 hypothetical protein E4U35_005131 [Claviceps purpurea]KAG6238250.1 hypothetical protein E4U25_001864 [Claviceps purpurea]KAG6310814.1 hypothetical protein E4U44_005034 [Claviceps purpurea]